MQNSESYLARCLDLNSRDESYKDYVRTHHQHPTDCKMLTPEEHKELNVFRQRAAIMKNLKSDRGKRYAKCTFSNYTCNNEKQKHVVEQLRNHVEDVESLTTRNVVLFGPAGSGKDHLLMAMASAAFELHGVVTSWRQGVDLHQQMRLASFADNRCDLDLDVTKQDRTCPILWISDPLPPSGTLTEFQQSQVFSLIDRRYSDMLPTWTTLNVADGAEAELRIGGQVIDRLRHDAVVINCNWPSYRQAKSAGVAS